MIAQTFKFFISNEWIFSTTKLMKMFNWLSPSDQKVKMKNENVTILFIFFTIFKEFNFDPATIDWFSCVRSMSWGLRRYVSNEDNLMHPDELSVLTFK